MSSKSIFYCIFGVSGRLYFFEKRFEILKIERVCITDYKKKSTTLSEQVKDRYRTPKIEYEHLTVLRWKVRVDFRFSLSYLRGHFFCFFGEITVFLFEQKKPPPTYAVNLKALGEGTLVTKIRRLGLIGVKS